MRRRMPLTISSFVEIGGRLALYAAGVAAMVHRRAAHRARRRARVAGVVLVALRRPGARRAIAVANPEALRHGLQFVYGWVPARRGGRCRLDRAAGAPQREPVERGRAADLRLRGRARPAVAARTYLRRSSSTPRLADGRVLRAVRRRASGAPAPLGARPEPRGASRSARRGSPSSSSPASELTLNDASDETRHGARAGRLDPGAGVRRRRLPGGASTRSSANTRPGEPILAAPFLTGLYVLTGRDGPGAATRRCCPARTPRPRTSRPPSRSSSATASGSRSRPTAPLVGVRTTRPSATPSGASSTAGFARNFTHVQTLARLWLRAARPRRLDPEVTDMKRVGVTGAAGFIGSHLCERLLSEGRRGRRRRRPLHGHDGQPGRVPRPPRVPVRAPRLHPAPRPARGLRPLRRDRAPGRPEDPAVRRRAHDARVERGRRQRGVLGGALPRRGHRDRVDLGRVRQRDAAVRRGRQPRARPADDPPLGVRRLEAVRRARRAGPRRGARLQGHDPAAVRRPTARTTTPAGGAARSRPSSRRCSTAA